MPARQQMAYQYRFPLATQFTLYGEKEKIVFESPDLSGPGTRDQDPLTGASGVKFDF